MPLERRLFGLEHQEPPRGRTSAVEIAALAEAAQRAKRHAYREGLVDGTLEVLDQLEGRSTVVQGPAPPLTEELRDWIAAVRARVEQEKAGLR